MFLSVQDGYPYPFAFLESEYVVARPLSVICSFWTTVGKVDVEYIHISVIDESEMSPSWRASIESSACSPFDFYCRGHILSLPLTSF